MWRDPPTASTRTPSGRPLTRGLELSLMAFRWRVLVEARKDHRGVPTGEMREPKTTWSGSRST
eukprot:3200278-Pyramimonas_sp.AAC.1